MSAAEIERLLSDYRMWLKDKTKLRELEGDWVEITTPTLTATMMRCRYTRCVKMAGIY